MNLKKVNKRLKLGRRVSVWKETDDCWFPSFGDNRLKLVEVSFLRFIDNSGYTCAVWGADDFGMACESKSRTKCWEIFQYLIMLEKVNIEELKEMGFKRC